MTDLLCKDCKHSHMSLGDRIMTLGGKVGVTSTHYRCTKFPKEESIDNNLVTGPKKVKYSLPYCEVVRMSSRSCSPAGTYWTPKYKKDLFKMLTKENHD